MKYAQLGRTGVNVSKLCLGTMNFGGRTSAEEAEKMVKIAIDNGINFIDTANVYGHEPGKFVVGRGRSEKILGDIFTKNNLRDEIFLASKVRFEMGEGVNDGGISRYHIRKQIAASLKRLQTDHIDLYQLHSSMNNIPIDETLRILDELIYQNKISYIGTSSFAAWQLMESLSLSEKLGLNRFVTEQAAYNLLDRRIERELVPMTQTYGIGLITWSPLAGGFLTGKYTRNSDIPKNTRYSEFWKGLYSMFNEQAFDVLDILEELSKNKGYAIDQITLAWLLKQDHLSSIIIGPRTVEQLESNLQSIEIDLSAEDMDRIDKVAIPFRMISSFYGPDTLSGFGHIRWGPKSYR